MGVFEKLPYLNYHDINLDWLVKQTKKNASDNSFLMKIFKWFNDQGLVGVVTEITENLDDTVKIDYADINTMTTDDFTVYNKTGADNAISGAQSAAESYADNAIADAFKGLGDLPAETDLQDTDLLLINRSGAAEAIAGDVVAKQSDMDTVQGNITDLYDIADFKLNAYSVGTGNPTRTLTLPSAYAPFIAFGLYEGAVTCHIFAGAGGSSLSVAKLANTGATLPFINVDTNKFTFTPPTATNLTLIGLNIEVE